MLYTPRLLFRIMNEKERLLAISQNSLKQKPVQLVKDVELESPFGAHANQINEMENIYGNPYVLSEENNYEENDAASCIVDLNKVKKQFEIWQDSFGGKN